MPSLVDEARERAETLVIGNGDVLGLLGSARAYRQVWARDSMICGLGLLVCQDREGEEIHRRSLQTLRTYQTPLGNIPHHVGYAHILDPALIAHGGTLGDTEQEGVVVTDTAHSGSVDGAIWYIINQYYTYEVSRDRDFLREAWGSLRRAMLWLQYQDSNECGLLEVHEAKDWADLFANRYNVLYSNALYYAAWKSMGHMARALDIPSDSYFENAEDVRRKLNTLLWIGPEEPKDWAWLGRTRREWLYPLKRVETELVERPFYLPYMAFRDYADRFDTLGNLIAILFGVADQRKADKILDYIHGCGLNEPFPVRALYPVINPGEHDWREYYRVRNLNLPYHYHNGGAWPFVGGFYVAALVQAGRLDEARRQLEKLAEMNRMGKHEEWEFNEWFHGHSGRPMGFGGQSWSAAMYVFAHECVQRGAVNVFNAQNGWAL
ncbi:MAG TPA: glycoside hydrolase 100 family protein [Ardenticatenaceae bacterium]|jgi:glycogen debranching enzyme